MRPTPVLAVMILPIALAGCSRYVWHSYALPSTYHHQYGDATACVDKCRQLPDQVARLACIEKCPGVMRVTGSHCADYAIACTERLENSVGAAAKLAGTILLVAGSAAASAAEARAEAKGRELPPEDARLSTGLAESAAAVGSTLGVPPPPPRPASPLETRCPPRPPSPAACSLRVSNLHHSGETCSYFCLDHCAWHAPEKPASP